MYFNRFYADDIINFAISLGVKEGTFAPEQKQFHPLQEGEQLSYEQIASLLQKAVRRSNNPHFGLHLGEFFDLKATKAVDQIMDNSPTVRAAFQHAVYFSRLISDSMDCAIQEWEDRFQVNFEFNPDWAIHPQIAIRHNLDTALVCAFKSMHRLTTQTHYPSLLQLPYPKPRFINEYFRIFNCRVTYNCQKAAIVFQRRLLDESIHSQNKGLLEMLLENARKELHSLPANSEIINRVKKAILAYLLKGEFPNIDQVAQSLSLGVRTLQRQLQAESQRFNKIVINIKMDLAIRHLCDNRHSVEEVAYLLGYAEPSSFIRAFRRAKGQSPKRYVKGWDGEDFRG